MPPFIIGDFINRVKQRVLKTNAARRPRLPKAPLIGLQSVRDSPHLSPFLQIVALASYGKCGR